MKTKQVVAFLMAATLTVTSGGVSALASQNAAEALQEETAIEELITEEGTDGEIREFIGEEIVPGSTEVSEDQESGTTVSLSPSTDKVTYTESVKLTATVKPGAKVTITKIQIVNKENKVVVESEDNLSLKEETKLEFNVRPEFPDIKTAWDTQAETYQAIATLKYDGNDIPYRFFGEKAYITVNAKELGEKDIAISSLDNVEISGKDLGLGKEELEDLDNTVWSGIKEKIKEHIPDAAKAAVQARLDEMNKDSAYSEYGKWTLSDTGKAKLDSDKGELKLDKVDIAFAFNPGYKKAADNAKADGNPVSVKFIQKTMYIRILERNIKDDSEASKNNKFSLPLSTKTKVFEAKVYPDNTANDLAIEWTSSNGKVVTVAKPSESVSTLAVASAVSAGTSTITATAQDGSEVSDSAEIKVDDGLTPEDVDFSMFPNAPETMDYKGDGTVSEYLYAILQSANADMNGIGKYSIEANESVSGSKVAGEPGSDLGAGQSIKYMVRFTLDDPKKGSGEGWKDGSIEKELTLVVVPHVITKEEALKEILGDNKDKKSFSIGTLFGELASSVNGKYVVLWYESDGKTGVQNDTLLPVGTNTYVLTYREGGNFGNGYILEAGDRTYSMTITVEEPKLEVEILAGLSNKDGEDIDVVDRTDYKFPQDEYVKLYAKVNGNNLGTYDNKDKQPSDLADINPFYKYYRLSYNWVYNGVSVNGGGADSGEVGYSYYMIGSKWDSQNKEMTDPQKLSKEYTGEYKLIVTGTLLPEGKKQPWYLNADPAKQAEYQSLMETASITIDLTNVEFKGVGFAPKDSKNPYATDEKGNPLLIYGNTAGNKFKATITAANVQSYTVCYREVVDEKEQEEKTLPTYTLNDAERALFASSIGNGIGEKYDGVDIGNLDAGTYRFYVRVKTSEEEASSNKVTLVVDKKPITAATYKDKIVVEPITYGGKYSDAKVTIPDDADVSSMVQLKVKEGDVAKKAAPVNVTVVRASTEDPKNYTLVGDWTFKKVLDVSPYASTIRLNNKTVAAGANLEFTADDWSADILDINGEKKEDVFKLDFEVRKDGKKVNFLTPGTYELTATASSLDSNYSVGNVEYATLTVGDGGSETNGIQFNKKQIVFTNIGKTREFAAAVVPATESNAGLTFESSDESVATVEVTDAENGKAVVTAVANGEADIVVTAPNGVSGKLHVTVKQEPKKVVISRSGKTVSGTISVSVGKKYNFDAKVQPSTVAVKGVKWSTSNAKIATVSKKGKVTVKAAGTVKIKATAKGGAKSKTITLKAK